MRTCLNSHCNEGAGKCVYIIPELAVCAGIIESGVFKGVLIGKFFNHTVEYIRKCGFDKKIFFPGENAGVTLVVIKHLFVFGCVAELSDKVNKLGKDDLAVVKLGAPCGIPYK